MKVNKSHKFKKNFGQNFLRTKRFAQIMVDSLDIKSGDLVLEIGPGEGIVTDLVLRKEAKLLSVEIDYSLLVNLIKKFSDNPNFKLVHKDFLDLNIYEALSSFTPDATEYKVIGSLPFNISKRIINILFHEKIRATKGEIKHSPTHMSFILQEEVTKIYSAKAPNQTHVSAIAQTFCKVRKLESIPASQFYPEPRVNGGICYFEFHRELPENAEEIIKIINAGFKSPRKTLYNNLKPLFKNDEQLKALFEKLGIKPSARAAELENEQWRSLLQNQ